MNEQERIKEMRKRMIHNHSMTNFNFYGPRPPYSCPACDHMRESWRRAAEEGR